MRRQSRKEWPWMPSIPPIPPIPAIPPIPPFDFQEIGLPGFFSSTQVRTETRVLDENGNVRYSARHTEETSMRYFLLVFEPKGGANLGALNKTVQKMEAWWSYLDRVWILGTTESADELWGRLSGFFGKNDNVLIIELPAGPDRQGWLPTEAWEWFNKSMPRRKGGEARPKKADSPPQRPEPKPRPVETDDSPTVDAMPKAPEPPAQMGNLTCDFCGTEAPAYVWVDNECPRCGIKRS